LVGEASRGYSPYGRLQCPGFDACIPRERLAIALDTIITHSRCLLRDSVCKQRAAVRLFDLYLQSHALTQQQWRSASPRSSRRALPSCSLPLASSSKGTQCLYLRPTSSFQSHTCPSYRHAAFQSVSDSEASQQILAKQRLNRPVSPHLGIYKPQITWYGSALNRVTGVTLSGTFYLFGLSYLIAPAFGWHVESASLAASFAAWPAALAIFAKLVASFPFTYHSFNGLRHLMWDMGKGITNKQVQVTGWTVVGLSVVTSFLLALI
jgi:succinate dehydrogenase (ubiquinone) cytochrome b560 subunit